MERERQLQTDCETLREVLPGLERLEGQWNDARLSVGARARGYFTPDEDDRVRQMLLAYRNYRIALYGIIRRGYGYERIEPPKLKLQVFLAAFAAALTLYAKSLKLIQAYEHDRLVRKKLNEPDAKFEIEAGFFEDLLRAYGSLRNYTSVIRGTWFWLKWRRQINQLDKADPNWQWVADVVLKQRAVIRKRLTHVLLCRLRYDWRNFGRTLITPVRRTRYDIHSFIGGAGATLRVPGEYKPALTAPVAAQLRAEMQPGDVLLVREEGKLTATILPGFWAHAVFYVGSQKDLDTLGVVGHPHVRKHWDDVAAHDQGLGCAIEALAPRVRIASLQNALLGDHAVVLRPKVTRENIAAALTEVFGHLGKPYDFEFDFNVSTRIVCTELIYRCYDRPGGIQFPLVKRLGRYTLTGDDIADMVLNSLSQESESGKARFELVAMALKTGDGEATFVERDDLLPTLRRIQGGWKPTRVADAVPA